MTRIRGTDFPQTGRTGSIMIHSTRFKLIASFLVVSFLVGGISLFIGGYLLYNAVLREANNQAGMALKAAEDVYRTQVKYVSVALSITTLGDGFRAAVADRNQADLTGRVYRLARQAELDFAGIVMKDGTTLCRVGPNALPGDDRGIENPVARYVISSGTEIAGTAVLPKTFLSVENPVIAKTIQFFPFENSQPQGEDSGSCLAIAAAIPIFEYRTSGDLIGVLYGGNVLNQSTGMIDLTRKSGFFGEVQAETGTPTATIFLGINRIATNILDESGKRAIGTRVSDEVNQQVLARGNQWTTRDRFLNENYIAAFAPLTDIIGRRVGMLSIAVPESNYSTVQEKFIFFFIIATVMGAMIAVLMGALLAQRIMAPVHRLIKASQEVSEGTVTPDIGPISDDKEIAILQTTFRHMVEQMKRRRMESQSKILQSEKQASVGRLAAGVAHEINNPLTGVLTYTHMLLRRKDIADDVRSDLQVIVESTERVRKIVKGLLDFSRQTKLDPEATDINRLVSATIKLIENQALLKGVHIEFTPGDQLPPIVLDRSQMESVLLNIMLNALDATKPSDTIAIHTAAALSASDPGHRGVEITIGDTGCGIPPENLNKLFDPFFSTKEVGQGTGLGLAVSLGIVKEHGGEIRVQSEVGKGSIFFVWLPVERQVENANTRN